MNGKKKDHPLSDLLFHNLTVFDEETDSLIKEISKYVSFYKLNEMFDWFNPPSPQEFKKQLQNMLMQLKKEAKERGWEVL